MLIALAALQFVAMARKICAAIAISLARPQGALIQAQLAQAPHSLRTVLMGMTTALCPQFIFFVSFAAHGEFCHLI